MANAKTDAAGGADNGSDPSYTERATAAAHDAVDRMGAKAAEAEERIRETADELRRRSYDARGRANDLGEEAVISARTYMREHPIASLAIAFGVGALMSSLLRR